MYLLSIHPFDCARHTAMRSTRMCDAAQYNYILHHVTTVQWQGQTIDLNHMSAIFPLETKYNCNIRAEQKYINVERVNAVE
jgi:formylmethanofuran dehydrogenase subunit A